MADLSKVSTGELQVELARRQSEAEARRAVDLKTREIEIECPICEGSCKIPERDGYQIYGYIPCIMCNGTGHITAYRRS
jgi:hypothetical protein